MQFQRTGRFVTKCITHVGNIGAVAGVFGLWVVVSVTVIEVVSRRIFGVAFTDVVTIGQICMVVMGFMAAAYTQRYERHVSIRFVIDHLPSLLAYKVRAFGLVICLITLVVMVFLTSQYTWFSFTRGSLLIAVWEGLPIWIFQIFVPVGLSMLAIQLLVQIVRDFYLMLGSKVEDTSWGNRDSKLER